jgi:hypothetical protein
VLFRSQPVNVAHHLNADQPVNVAHHLNAAQLLNADQPVNAAHHLNADPPVNFAYCVIYTEQTNTISEQNSLSFKLLSSMPWRCIEKWEYGSLHSCFQQLTEMIIQTNPAFLSQGYIARFPEDVRQDWTFDSVEMLWARENLCSYLEL